MQLVDYISHTGDGVEDTVLTHGDSALNTDGAIPTLMYYYYHNGEWLQRDLPPEIAEMRVGASSEKCEVTIEDPDADPVQLVVRRIGATWYLIESGKNDITKVDGFEKRQTRISLNQRAIVIVGDTPFIFSAALNQRHPTPEPDFGPPIKNEFSLTVKGEEYKFPLEKTCLIGSSKLCDVEIEGEPFAAVVSHFGRRLFIHALSQSSATDIARDGMLVTGDVPLAPGSVIRVGGVEMLFKVSKDLRFSQEFKFAPDPSMACLKLLELNLDGSPGESYALPPEGRSLFIGRDASQCELPIVSSKKVSRKHAQVIIYDKMILLIDMGAKNGTFVNGEKIKKKVLHPGDVARLADVRFLLCYTG